MRPRVPDAALSPEVVAQRRASAEQHHAHWRALRSAGDVFGAAAYLAEHEDAILPLIEASAAAARAVQVPARDPAVVAAERAADVASLNEHRRLHAENPVQAAHHYLANRAAIERARRTENDPPPEAA